MVDSVDTRVLWSERAVLIQRYGTEEEHPQTLQWTSLFFFFFQFLILLFLVFTFASLLLEHLASLLLLLWMS